MNVLSADEVSSYKPQFVPHRKHIRAQGAISKKLALSISPAVTFRTIKTQFAPHRKHTRAHGSISQKLAAFITPGVRTSNPT
jgi:hypothetical protein